MSEARGISLRLTSAKVWLPSDHGPGWFPLVFDQDQILQASAGLLVVKGNKPGAMTCYTGMPIVFTTEPPSQVQRPSGLVIPK